jgi:hypothetical protein
MTILSEILAPSNLVTVSGTQTLTNKTLDDPIVLLDGTSGTAGQVLVSQGSGLPPEWGASGSANAYTWFLF